MVVRVVVTLVAVGALAGCQTAGTSVSDSKAATAAQSGKRYGLTTEDFNDAIRRGEGKQAMAFYQREAEARLARGDRAGALTALARAMSMAYRIAELQEGLRIARHGLDVLDEAPSSVPWYVQCELLDLVGTVHLFAGLRDDAERYWKRGLATAANNYFRGTFYRHLGDVAKDRGDSEAARAHLRQAVEVFGAMGSDNRRILLTTEESTRSFQQRLDARRELARSLLSLAPLQPPSEAEQSLRLALAHARWLGFADELITALNALANLEIRRQSFAKAETWLSEALGIATKAKHDTFLVQLHSTLGRAYYLEGRYDEALAELKRSLEIIESVRARFAQSTARSAYVENKQAVYHGAVLAALQTDRAAEAFTLAERSRSRAFLDMLGTHTSLARVMNPALAAAETDVLAKLALAGPAPAVEETPDSSAQQSTSLRDVAVTEYDRFVNRVRAEDREQASLMAVEPVSAADVQGLLPQDTALVEYLVTPTETVAWVLRRDSLAVVRLGIPREQLIQQVQGFRRVIAEHGELDALLRQAQALHVTVFQDVAQKLRARRVIIVPHDVLHYLPFAALRTPEARWLVEEYTLTTVPSASVLKYLRGKGENPPARALVVGNPSAGSAAALPFAELEARMVREHFADGTLLVRDDATKESVKTLSTGAGVIHFATHGLLREGDPLSSALVLAGGEAGRLDVREIFRLDLNARLVVLSACETGLGKLSRGDELIGLQRAFLYAGARAVATTLWKVEDRATFDLMRDFYDALATRTPADALRDAQRAALARSP